MSVFVGWRVFPLSRELGGFAVVQALITLVLTLAGVVFAAVLMVQKGSISISMSQLRNSNTLQNHNTWSGRVSLFATPVLLFFALGALGVLMDVQRHDSLWSFVVRVLASVVLTLGLVLAGVVIGQYRNPRRDPAVLEAAKVPMWATSAIGVFLTLLYLFVVR